MKNILVYPNELLNQKAQEVKLPLSEEDKKLLNEMFNFVKESQKPVGENEELEPGDPRNNPAVGLAAPQVGVLKRMFVVRINLSNLKLLLKIVNPRVIVQDKRPYFVPGGEGCLSEPDVRVMVPRARRIFLTGFDTLSNKMINVTLEGYAAAVVQHEYDHLEGKLLHDYQGGGQIR